MTTQQEHSEAYKQAVAQVQSIVALVNALECDFDRLEELREELECLTDAVNDAASDLDQSVMFLREADAVDDSLIQAGAVQADRQRLADAQKELASCASSREELAELEEAAGEWSDRDDVEEAIQQDPLSVEVRSGWAHVGDSLTPEEFRVVLCTGGPHVELVGNLDGNCEPSRVRVFFKDWGEGGEYYPDAAEREALMTYLGQLYFGEGR